MKRITSKLSTLGSMAPCLAHILSASVWDTLCSSVIMKIVFVSPAVIPVGISALIPNPANLAISKASEGLNTFGFEFTRGLNLAVSGGPWISEVGFTLQELEM